MIEQGELELDRPLYEYFPGLLDMFATEKDKEYAKVLTPRICMTHRTGLDNRTYANISFINAPDIKYGYSGPGIFVLQRTIEHIKGESLKDIAQREIFGPLGMEHTCYEWIPEYEQTHLYGHYPDLTTIRNKNWKGGKCNAAYSMRTSAAECTKFVRAAMHQWNLGDEAFAMMTKPYGDVLPAEYTEREKGSLYRCLGWSYERNEEFGDVFWHGGNNGAYKGLVVYIPSIDASLVYLTNGQHPYNINDTILNLFFDPEKPFSFVRKGTEELPD